MNYMYPFSNMKEGMSKLQHDLEVKKLASTSKDSNNNEDKNKENKKDKTENDSTIERDSAIERDKAIIKASQEEKDSEIHKNQQLINDSAAVRESALKKDSILFSTPTPIPAPSIDYENIVLNLNEQIQYLEESGNLLVNELMNEMIQDDVEMSNMIQNTKNLQNHFLNAIHNQNTSLQNNITYMSGLYSGDNQKIAYEQQLVNYWVRINFWLFYIYVILALIYSFKLFAYGSGKLSGKIFWYLHILFLPYLAIYTEIALYLFLSYVYSWITGTPFVVWNYFTSYPPIV